MTEPFKLSKPSEWECVHEIATTPSTEYGTRDDRLARIASIAKAKLSQPSAPGVDAEDIAKAIADWLYNPGREYSVQERPQFDSKLAAIIRSTLAAAPKPTEHSGGDGEIVSSGQQAAARLVPGFAPNSLADRLEQKAADLRKTIEHARVNDSGWYDVAPLGRWEGELSDLEQALVIIRKHTPTTPPSGDERAALADAIDPRKRRYENSHGGTSTFPATEADLIAASDALRAKHTSGPLDRLTAAREGKDG